MNKALAVFVVLAILTIVLFVGIEVMFEGHSEESATLANEWESVAVMYGIHL
ncbi:hypothetical protein [Virgibacillus ainsalahensis]